MVLNILREGSNVLAVCPSVSLSFRLSDLEFLTYCCESNTKRDNDWWRFELSEYYIFLLTYFLLSSTARLKRQEAQDFWYFLMSANFSGVSPGYARSPRKNLSDYCNAIT